MQCKRCVHNVKLHSEDYQAVWPGGLARISPSRCGLLVDSNVAICGEPESCR